MRGVCFGCCSDFFLEFLFLRSKEKMKGVMSMNGFQMNPIVGIGFCAWKARNA